MPTQVELQPGKKIYFASDFHFGIPDYKTTREREVRVCKWLDEIKTDAQQIYLLGDLFDSWMEYKRVVPKGSVRFFGKLAELSDAGIDLIIFTGNHDLWVTDYFETEFKASVYHDPVTIELGQKRFHLGHGDGLVKQEGVYKMMKAVFRHPLSRFIYRQLHPDLGLRLADFFSRLGPKHKYEEQKMLPPEQEYQLIYANELLKTTHYDYFIFGHRHLPCTLKLNNSSTFINLGDWISFDTYAIYDGIETRLEKY